jgi:hypothetical protein
MLLSELTSMFLTRYELECRKRKETALILNDGEMAFFLSDAQQDIQRRLKVLKGYTDITLVPNMDSYALPTNFGQSILALIDQTKLRKSNTILENAATIGQPCEYVIVQGQIPHILLSPTPDNSYVLRLYYYLDTLYYRPSLSFQQDWGTFNGIAYTGSALLPDKYSMAIIYKMLSMMIDSFEAKYESELQRLRGGLVEDLEDTMRYNFGGIEEPSIARIITGITNSFTATSPSASATPQLLFTIINANGNPNPLTIERNDFNAQLTFSLIDTGKYRVTSDLPIFVDGNDIEVKLLPRTDTEPYLLQPIRVSSYILDVYIIPQQSGGFADHDLRYEIINPAALMFNPTSVTDVMRGSAGLWADRPLVGIPIGYSYFAKDLDRNTNYFFNGVDYV